jgi:DNA-binding transcriptional MerR regulator
MKTVKQICDLTGVSVRTLHHYDSLGLLKPTRCTEAGYRLYDDAALERLCLILLFREIGLPLKEIQQILDHPDFRRDQVLEQQIALLEQKANELKRAAELARAIRTVGVNQLNLEGFHMKKANDYAAQAKALYGKTPAYKEFEQKSAGRTQDQEQDLGQQLMGLFVKLGKNSPADTASPAALAWAKELQDFITAHYYRCTPEIFACLADSYAAEGSMNDNIDKAAGPGTGKLAREIILNYLKTL